MHHTAIVRTLALALPLVCFIAVPLAAQDSQDTSVAEAARRAREQKKASAKPATVITNDTLSPAPASAPATSPTAPPAPGAQSSTPAGQQPAAAAAETSTTPEEAEQKKKHIEDLKKELAALQGEVDLAQRSLSLDQDAYYSKPDFSNDKNGKAKLDAALADLKLKQDELAQLKAKLAELGFVEEPKTPTPPAKP